MSDSVPRSDNVNKSWRILELGFSDLIHANLLQQQQAVQLIGMVGKYMIPQEEDDSNTSMIYDAGTESFLGNVIERGIRVSFSPGRMELIILDRDNKALSLISLIGLDRSEAFTLLKSTLTHLQLETENLSEELHYKIPDHPLAPGESFRLDESRVISENLRYRHNAQIVIEKVSEKFQNAEPVRTWPHHFDTGSFVTLEKNTAGGVSKSIGLGWAIPDKVVTEPYYYLNYWSEEPVENFKSLPDPEAGQWIPEIWNGAILKNSEILDSKNAGLQEETVIKFFDSGIRILIDHISL